MNITQTFWGQPATIGQLKGYLKAKEEEGFKTFEYLIEQPLKEDMEGTGNLNSLSVHIKNIKIMMQIKDESQTIQFYSDYLPYIYTDQDLELIELGTKGGKYLQIILTK